MALEELRRYLANLLHTAMYQLVDIDTLLKLWMDPWKMDTSVSAELEPFKQGRYLLAQQRGIPPYLDPTVDYFSTLEYTK